MRRYPDFAAYDQDTPDHVVEHAYDYRNRWVRRVVDPDGDIARLRTAAAKEKQMARQVELNLEVKRLEKAKAECMERI